MRPRWQRIAWTAAGLVVALAAVATPAVLAQRGQARSCDPLPAVWCKAAE